MAAASTTPPADSVGEHAVIVGGNRIPFGKAGGAYRELTNLDMLTAALEGLVARFGLAGERVGEVIAGSVLKHARDFNLSREAVLGSSLDAATPATDIQKACATSIEAAAELANKIRLGQIQSGITGGVESVSDAPIALNDRLRRILLEASRARSVGQRLKIFARIRPSDLAPAQPRVDEPRTGLSMGEHQAITTAHWAISREAQDELAYASHHNLGRAWEAGFFDDLVTAYHGQSIDQILRADTSLEKLASLKPVFGKDLPTEPTMTAGNSTALTDGAATVLLASASWASERGLPALAKVIDSEAAAVDFVSGDEGLLMAPVHAAPRLLARNGLTLDDFDFIEIHEAFAATALSTIAAWENEDYCRNVLGLDGAFGTVDRAKLNVNGSSLAAGHPFAATGARILASTAKLLATRGSGSKALVTVCAAGGQGVAMILEAA